MNPVIYNVSGDQVVNIVSGHETVALTCGAIGENIAGGYWEKIDETIPLSHNKSKHLLYNHGKVILQMTIIRIHPSYSGDYRCVIYNQWWVVKSWKVQVTIGSKG